MQQITIDNSINIIIGFSLSLYSTELYYQNSMWIIEMVACSLECGLSPLIRSIYSYNAYAFVYDNDTIFVGMLFITLWYLCSLPSQPFTVHRTVWCSTDLGLFRAVKNNWATFNNTINSNNNRSNAVWFVENREKFHQKSRPNRLRIVRYRANECK